MSRLPVHLLSIRPDSRLCGTWSRIEVGLSGLTASAIPFVTLRDDQGMAISSDIDLGLPHKPNTRSGEVLDAICFIPGTAAEVQVSAVGLGASSIRATSLICHSLPRWRAAMQLLARKPKALLSFCDRPVPLKPDQLRKRFRHVLAMSARDVQGIERDYATWINLFDRWRREDFSSPTSRIPIGYLVMARDTMSEALNATIRSLEEQHDTPPYVVLSVASPSDSLTTGLKKLETDYIGILQAGEILPRHATLMAAVELDRLGRPEIAIVDEDEISSLGVRHSPAFKPTPNHTLMLSGTLSRGLWLVRRTTLIDHAGPEVDWAEALRLQLWLARSEGCGDGFSQRIPFILSHRRPDTEAAAPSVLAEIVERHLKRRGAVIEPQATWPLTFRIKKGARDERVTVVVPSTLRRPHSLDCIIAILRGTDYADLDLQVAVSQAGPLDTEQRRAAAEVEAFPNAKVTKLDATSFNFSWVNNQVIARTQSEHVLLLNDDVSPIHPDWLRWMAAFLREPYVGMVGARLLYPNGRVQHGGVIMGLAGLCDHTHRNLPGTEPGYMWRAVLAQELSAVTAACMLVRRRLLERVGGLDESYPSAFNDVDLALRVGELGYAVVYAPQAELHHHELQTYGSHYTGDRQVFRAKEVNQMHTRWARVCAADPFHSPNLGLEPGREWRPAFPPRVDVGGR